MNLERTMNDKVVAGVCGGIAKALNLSSTKLRWIFAFLILFGGISLWVYLAAWFIIPSDCSDSSYRGD